MSIRLTESVLLSEGSAVRVDRERGVIGPVKVLGWKSANNRDYLPEGVNPALYEGRRVCVGHVQGGVGRSPFDTYGLLEGVSKNKSGVYAERLRLLNPKGDFEQRLLSAAESAPHLFGLSHTARGREKAGSGGKIIESVESVESVDLVTDPATVRGFYESRNQPVRTKIRDLIESLKGKRPGYVKALREMAEAGIMSPDAEMDAPVEAEAPEESGDHKQALMDALKALCDEADSLDEGELMKKFKAILKLIKGDSGGTETETETETETPAEESKRRKEFAAIREENERLKAEKLVRKVAALERVAITETLVEGLARPGMTEAKAKALVNELKATGGGQRPRSAAPAGNGSVRESKAEPPEGGEAFGTWLRGS